MKTAATLAAAACFALTFGALADDDIKREGVGQRRTALNRMELNPFPADWSQLSEWTNGEALAPETTEGKVVLIATFAAWNPTSTQILSTTQRLHKRHAEDGLIVVGVHHATGWEQAPSVLEQKKVEHLVALDAAGKFRRTLDVDQDPDFYFIDRAGNLRYADVDTSSVTRAVRKLLGESVDDAQAAPGAVEAARQAREREARRARGAQSTVIPGSRMNVEFEMPGDEAYENARWPWRGLLVGKTEFDANAERFENEPPTFELPEEDWWGEKPEGEGRLLVVYIFDPKRHSSNGIVDRMNHIQTVYNKDVDVVGAAVNFTAGRWGVENQEDKAKLVERNTKAVKKFFEHREINHPIMLGIPNVDQIYEGGNEIPLTRGEDPGTWAWAFIISTDNKIRYGGHPYWDSFEQNIRQLLAVDPGAKARQRAEDRERRNR